MELADLKEIRFPFRSEVLAHERAKLRFVRAVLFGMVFAIAGAMIYTLPAVSPPSVGAISSLLFVLIGMAAFGLMSLLVQPFTVAQGVVNLPLPLKRRSGGWTRHVRLDEIGRVEPIASPKGHRGVLISLRDGTQFYLFGVNLPDGGAEFLQRLVVVFESDGRLM